MSTTKFFKFLCFSLDVTWLGMTSQYICRKLEFLINIAHTKFHDYKPFGQYRLKYVKKMLFGHYIVGCGLGGVKMDQSSSEHG